MAYGAAGTTITGSPPACRAFHSTTQTAATATHQPLALDSSRFDPTAMHSTSVNNTRITFTAPGVYLVQGQFEWASNASGGAGVRQIEIRLNGSNSTLLSVSTIPGMANVGQPQSIATVYKFAANDYVELVAFQTTGVTMTINSSGNYSPEFAAMWMGLGT